MKVFITGGTGFIGRRLAALLLEKGHTVAATGSSSAPRNIEHDRFHTIQADTMQPGDWQDAVRDAELVVNLAGRSIMNRWTDRYKKEIRDSRLLTTRNVVQALPQNGSVTLCSASAVGYYGNRGDETLSEDAAPGEGFLAELGREWEAEALKAKAAGARVALMRFGVVLGKGGGAMEKMIPAFRFYLGGPMGDGSQWFPWIHIDDVLSAVLHIAEHPDLEGPFNFTAPHPVRNRDMAATLGKVLRVPARIKTPRFMLKLALGEVGETLLESQRALPDRLLKNGYEFRYPDLESALQQIVQ
jgi:hypothetical protein